ncbi:MAG: universal stress protein [Desulfobulbaceae bacterium]|nr:universal stress protein [Desulfobulbaceae bacterium]
MHNVRVSEHKQNIFNDAAAAVAFSDAGEYETARSIIDRNKGRRTILVFANGDSFSENLNDYALEMAKRLDYELLALHVTEAPLALSDEKRETAMSAFRESCLKNVKTLGQRADKIGVSFNHVIECGNPDSVVAKLHARYPGMRYVLTEPAPGIVRSDAGRTEIPVFDLGSYQPSAA